MTRLRSIPGRLFSALLDWTDDRLNRWFPPCGHHAAMFPAPGAAPGQAQDAGAVPSPAAAEAAPPRSGRGDAAPARSPAPGPGQSTAWVTVHGSPGSPLPGWRGDYRPTEPFRALPPVDVTRPYVAAREAWRDMPAGWTA